MKKRACKLLFIISIVAILGLTACNKSSEEEKPAEECHHVYGEYIVDGDYHYQKCTLCGHESEKEAHRGGTATFEHKAICDVCGAEYGELLPSPNIDQWYNTRQANESGIINFIKQGMKQYGLSFHDYMWSEHLKEVEFQYDRKIVRSSFYTKYKNLFE